MASEIKTALIYRDPDPSKGERATRVFVRCTGKECRRRLVLDTLKVTEKTSRGYGRTDYATLYLRSESLTRADGVSKTEIYYGPLPLFYCECGRLMAANGLKGTTSDTPCDARCTGATGHNCECQCSGRNHGSDYAIATTEIVGAA
jgi:hypothetical protein